VSASTRFDEASGGCVVTVRSVSTVG
jgi:hypothetical protein